MSLQEACHFLHTISEQNKILTTFKSLAKIHAGNSKENRKEKRRKASITHIYVETGIIGERLAIKC